MAYGLAWVVYLVAALVLLFVVYRYVETWFRRDLALLLRGSLLAVLFAPWFVGSQEGTHLVPACIAVLFHLLSHDYVDALKACTPIVLSGLVITVGLLLWYRSDAPEAD